MRVRVVVRCLQEFTCAARTKQEKMPFTGSENAGDEFHYEAQNGDLVAIFNPYLSFVFGHR